MKTLLFTLILLISLAATSQDNLKLLKRTGDPDLYQASGLTQTFSGAMLDDNKLYFRTSINSYDDYIWVTDGTTAGTQLKYNEQDYGRLEYAVYRNDGIYIIDKDGDFSLYFYDIQTDGIKKVSDLGDFKFFDAASIGEKDMLFGYNGNDKAELWITDRTESGTYKLGEAGENHYQLQFSASSSGAVIYNSNPWVEYEPVFIDLETEEITPLVDYLAPYKELDDIKRAYIHDNLLLLGVVEGGWQEDYIFDLSTKTFYASTFINDVKTVFKHGENDLYIITSNDLLYVNKSTFESEKIFDDVYPFSPFHVDADRLFFVNDKGWDYETNHVFYLDMNDQSFHEIEHTDIGESYYSCQIAIFEDELYYLERPRPDILLWKYNMQTMEKTLVDTVAVNNSSYTIDNALHKVGDELIVSRYENNEGHELYYLDWTSGTLQAYLKARTIEIYPNPVGDWININDLDLGSFNLRITNINGSEMMQLETDQKLIDISTFPPGSYYGSIKQNDEYFTFSFIKM